MRLGKTDKSVTALRLVFFGPGLEVTTRRAEITAQGVKFFTLAPENPGVGFENPGVGFEISKPGLVTTEAGTEKKEGGLGYSPLPFAKANIGIGVRNSKSAFSELTV